MFLSKDGIILHYFFHAWTPEDWISTQVREFALKGRRPFVASMLDSVDKTRVSIPITVSLVSSSIISCLVDYNSAAASSSCHLNVATNIKLCMS